MSRMLRLPSPSPAAAWLAALVLLGAPARPARAQQADGPPAGAVSAPELPAHRHDELVMKYVEAQNTDVHELTEVLMRFHSREFMVLNDDGTKTGPVENVLRLSRWVLLYDLPGNVARMQQTLAQLEGLGEDEPDGAPSETTLTTLRYVPRHVEVGSLARSLLSWERMIPVGTDGRMLTWASPNDAVQRIRNISMVESPPHLVLRDTAQNIEAMQAFIASLDVPVPQVSLSAFILAPAKEGEADPRVPAELAEHLGRLVPWKQFRLASMAMIRAEVMPGRRHELSGDIDGGQFELNIIFSNHDVSSGELGLASCAFKANFPHVSNNQELQTSATIRVGEYTVLGGSGTEPYFLALQAQQLER